MLYQGSCHCGAVAYEVEGEMTAVVSCNCSICSRKGALLMAVPREKLSVLAGEDQLASYTFNSNRIVHRFCRTCGMHPFAENLDDADGASAYVNIRCLADVDPAAPAVIAFDGRSL